MFLPVTTRTGAIRVRWAPFDAAECRIWLLLADPTTLRPDDLHPERLLQHMIRVPVEAGAGDGIVHAPVGRPLGLCLVWRDAADEPQSALPTSWSEYHAASPTTRENPATAKMRAPGGPPTTPPATEPRARPGAPALVVASERGTPPAPSTVVTDEPSSSPAIAALAARLLAAAPTPPPATPPPAGFGLQQPWYLGHLRFSADTSAPRVVVRRTTFIQAAELHTWRDAPPPDAVPVGDDCNTIIDASADVGETFFYAVLEGPAPWRSLPLAPVGPPFADTRSPCVFGDARSRLDAAIAAAQARGADPMVLEILDAARRNC